MKKPRWEYFNVSKDEHADIALEIYRAVTESNNEGEMLEKLQFSKEDYRAYLAGMFMMLSLSPNDYAFMKNIFEEDKKALEVLEFGECAKEYLKKIAHRFD